MGQISRQWPRLWFGTEQVHHNDVIMNTMASQITSLMIVYSNVYSDEDQRKHQRSASLAYVRGIDRSTVNSPHKGPVTRKMFPFDDIIMWLGNHDPVHVSQVPLYMYRGSILLVTPCLLTRIREFIHTQHRNTTRGRIYPMLKQYLWHSETFPQL